MRRRRDSETSSGASVGGVQGCVSGEGPLPAGMGAEPVHWCGRWTPTHLACCWMAHIACGFTCRALACRCRDQADEDLAGLLAANEAFYQAFCACDEGAMGRVWGDGPTVKVIHPRSGCIVGRAAVMESWRIVLGVGPTVVRCTEVQAAVAPRCVAARLRKRGVGVSISPVCPDAVVATPFQVQCGLGDVPGAGRGRRGGSRRQGDQHLREAGWRLEAGAPSRGMRPETPSLVQATHAQAAAPLDARAHETEERPPDARLAPGAEATRAVSSPTGVRCAPRQGIGSQTPTGRKRARIWLVRGRAAFPRREVARGTRLSRRARAS